jgi:phosphonate transport system substrate-binding protein
MRAHLHVRYLHRCNRHLLDQSMSPEPSYGRLGNVEEANKVLAGIQDGMGKFMESSNAQLYPIRQLALFKDKLKIQNTEELSADEKASRLAEVDKKLAELDILVSYE